MSNITVYRVNYNEDMIYFWGVMKKLKLIENFFWGESGLYIGVRDQVWTIAKQ